MTELHTDPERVLGPETGIRVRAKGLDESWGAVDIAHLDPTSLAVWLRKNGCFNPLAEATVFRLLGHDPDTALAALEDAAVDMESHPLADSSPRAWTEAMGTFARYAEKDYLPVQGEHDELYVCVDPTQVQPEDLRRLEELGWNPRSDMRSFVRYTSA